MQTWGEVAPHAASLALVFVVLAVELVLRSQAQQGVPQEDHVSDGIVATLCCVGRGAEVLEERR